MKYLSITAFILAINFTLSSQNYQVVWQNKIDEMSSPINIQDDDWFGYYIEPVGDLNNDKIIDLAVSAVKDDDGAFNKGAIYILFMNQDGSVSSYQKISQTQGNFNGQLNEYELFGTGLKYLGDLNNDGNFELAVGAEYNSQFNYRSGAIWILSIDNTGNVQSYQKIPGNNSMLNLSAWDVFGSDVTSIGDLNNDGTIDLAVGSRRYNDKGAVYILFMNPDLTINSFKRIAENENGFGSLSYQDYFGGSVAKIGDINNDGVVDLAVGAYRDNDGGMNSGAIYILFLDQLGNVNSYQKISQTQGNFNDPLLDNTQFGLSLSETIDINNDGLAEIIVSASGYTDASQNQYGAFYILNLNTDGTVENFVKYANGLQNLNANINDGDGFAMSVANIGLDNSNGLNIGIGAYLDIENTNEFERGSIYILNLGQTMSIEDYDEFSNVKFYPNPISNNIYIENHENILKVELFDVNGRKVSEFNQNFEKIDFSYIPVGNYLMKLIYKNKATETFKLLKK